MNNTYFFGNKYSSVKYLYYIDFNNNLDIKTRFITSAERNFFDGENEICASVFVEYMERMGNIEAIENI